MVCQLAEQRIYNVEVGNACSSGTVASANFFMCQIMTTRSIDTSILLHMHVKAVLGVPFREGNFRILGRFEDAESLMYLIISKARPYTVSHP